MQVTFQWITISHPQNEPKLKLENSKCRQGFEVIRTIISCPSGYKWAQLIQNAILKMDGSYDQYVLFLDVYWRESSTCVSETVYKISTLQYFLKSQVLKATEKCPLSVK